MASSIQLLRSTNPQERPFAGNLLEGQPAANLHSSEPGLFFKTTDGSVVKFGPAAITSDGSPPNSTPQGSAGNSIGELWLDKSVDPAVLKVYDGAQWVDAGSGGGGAGSFIRWIYTAIGGETSLSGTSGGVLLDYTPGLEEVYVNGVLITRGVDYSATNGTSITNLAPLTAGDVVTVLSMNPLETVQLPGQVTLLRWTILATAGQTVLSGIDSSSQQLAYTAGFEEVYVNGAFLRRGLDYTATNDSTITISSPLTVDDEVTVMAWSAIEIGSISSTTLSFTQAGSGAIARTVQSKLREVVSVEDFGAVGDGVTDDTAALVAASNYVRGVNGTLTFSKRGPYICKQQLFWSYMAVIGNNTIIQFDNLSPTTDCVRIGASRGEKPMTITRLTIDANNTGRDGVYCDGGVTDIGKASDHMMIDQLYVKNAVRDGFVMHTAGSFCWFEDFNISNLAVFECGRHGIRLDCDNFNACFINQGTFINPEVRLIAKTQPGYDVYIRNNCTFPGGKISELTWIGGEFDANYPLHGLNSFFFDDTRPGIQSSIGCGSWAFLGNTWESTSLVIPGFPPVMGCSANTKIDGAQVFGGVIAQYGDIIGLVDVADEHPATFRTSSRYYDYYPSAPVANPGAIQKFWFGKNAAMYGENDSIVKFDRGIRPRNLIVGSMSPTTAVNNTIHITNTTTPAVNPSNGGILFVEGGALKFRGSSGTVSTIAPA